MRTTSALLMLMLGLAGSGCSREGTVTAVPKPADPSVAIQKQAIAEITKLGGTVETSVVKITFDMTLSSEATDAALQHLKDVKTPQDLVLFNSTVTDKGLARSQGSVAALLKHGVSEDEIGLTALRLAAEKWLGDKGQPWYFSYRVRVGVK